MINIEGAESAGLRAAEIRQIVRDIENGLRLLGDFNRRVDRLERSGFSKRYEADIPNVIAKMEDVALNSSDGPPFSIVARVHSWIEDFSQDEIDAFVLSYRVFTQKNDRLSIPSLAGIYEKDWMPPPARECFEDARKQLNDHLDSPATVTFPEGYMLVRTLVDIVLFLVHSFVRPIVTELYTIRHSDITISENPDRLIVIVRNGKTGFRAANTMSGAVPVYRRILKRYPEFNGDDYLFLPHYKNRQTASRIIQRQFRELLKRASLEKDQATQSPHTLYSLRHTAICMRIILSEGQVNIFNLAKNAGTSVDQIERFYARNMPLSKEMARNLQSFGSG
jgi:DNA-binding Lrp family transcriptional regulator